MAVAQRPVSTEEKINSLARKISMLILAVAPGPLIAWLYFRARFEGLVFADSMDFAQIARHLTQGHGFTTSVIRPLMMAVSEKMGPQPDLIHAPLHAVATALFFGAMGAKDEVVAFSSIIFYLATIPVIYMLAVRMFNPRVAVISTVLYVATERLVSYAISGLPIALSMFLVTLLFLVIFGRRNPDDEEPMPRASRAFFAGALVALCYLTEYTSVVYLIPVGIYLFVTGGNARKKQVALFLIAFLIVSGPWMIRNMKLTGNPLFALSQYEILMQTKDHSAYTFYRTLPAKIPSPVGFAFTHISQMFRKFLATSAMAYSQVPALPGIFLMPFFLIGLFHSFGARPGRIRMTLLGMGFMTLLITAVMRGATEIFVPFLPLVIIFSAAYMNEALKRTEIHYFYQNAAMVLLVLVVAYPLILTFAAANPPNPNPARPSLEEMDTLIPRNQVVVSDIPWAVAWYSNHASVWLPLTDKDYINIEKKLGPMNFIYLSSMIRTFPAEEQVAMWQQIYYRVQPPRGFALARAYQPREAPDQVMLLFARPGAIGQPGRAATTNSR